MDPWKLSRLRDVQDVNNSGYGFWTEHYVMLFDEWIEEGLLTHVGTFDKPGGYWLTDKGKDVIS